MRAFLAAILAGALLAGTIPGSAAWAGPASERVFSRSALEQVETGNVLVYSHVRTGKTRPLEDGEIRVELTPGSGGTRSARVTMGETGKLRPVSAWPAASGNPLVPIFLESTLRTMAQATGGSEFYIRNRIKEALGSGGTMTDFTVEVDGKPVKAVEITFSPFDDDRNAGRMGAFRDMKLTFVVSEAVPGDVVRFSASTGGAGPEAYSEEIAFARLAEEN